MEASFILLKERKEMWEKVCFFYGVGSNNRERRKRRKWLAKEKEGGGQGLPICDEQGGEKRSVSAGRVDRTFGKGGFRLEPKKKGGKEKRGNPGAG